MVTADMVICGAGLAGISAAYHLAVRRGVRNVVVVDERPPMTLTSDKSTECYRNWWPGPGEAMVRFMNRSIDLLEVLADESNNFFQLNRRGYVFLTADPVRGELFRKTAEEISALGAGPLRVHTPGHTTYRPAPAEGFKGQPTGADLLFGADLIREHFPFVTEDVVAMLHPRRCGWLSAQQLGMYLLDKARAAGVRLLPGRVTSVAVRGGRVEGVQLDPGSEVDHIQTRCFINAAGPYLRQVGAMLGAELPVFNELHGKIAFNDTLGVVPRDAPLMIWSDPVHLPWSEEEQAELAADPETGWLLGEFPAGVHFRPEGSGDSPILLILWTYDVEVQEPVWPPHFDDSYPEIVLRGISRMVPGLAVYLERMSRPFVDGGYYCKTRENRLLVGPLPVEGAYVIGAMSGYGVMACQAAGELLAAHVTGGELPDYAPAFMLERYDDPVYQALLANWDATSGQL
ncbi:MAG: FAD-binding oxidoreductase [Chloroflexi bacterium]|nr:FAD-binding oxidoreductase [Chloroflexota bacterium]MCI0732112.1 FAD-binding oxidoreductase [Chloroflexota bacterium]